MKMRLPSPLPANVASPLVAAAERVGRLEPWTFMYDLQLIGARDEATGELRVASVLGALGQVFGIVLYRGTEGLNFVHGMLMNANEADQPPLLEGMNCLKVEWTIKRDLRKPDLALLAAAGVKPVGRGPIWLQFQSCTPGWDPWFINESEARQLTGDLIKVARFVELLRRVPTLYEGHALGEIPIVPGGQDGVLQLLELEWLPFVPPPFESLAPLALSPEDQATLLALPVREDAVFEVITPLASEISFLDETNGRPCFARVGLMVDRDSYFILASELAHGASPLHKVAAEVLVKGLKAAQTRPGALHVDDPRLEALYRPVSTQLGVSLHLTRNLRAANDALRSLKQHLNR